MMKSYHEWMTENNIQICLDKTKRGGIIEHGNGWIFILRIQHTALGGRNEKQNKSVNKNHRLVFVVPVFIFSEYEYSPISWKFGSQTDQNANPDKDVYPHHNIHIDSNAILYAHFISHFYIYTYNYFNFYTFIDTYALDRVDFGGMYLPVVLPDRILPVPRL